MLLSFVVLISACIQAASENVPSTGPVPTAQERAIATLFCQILQPRHVSKYKIDEVISQRAFGLYLKSIDPMKLYFTREDVDLFEQKYKDNFALLATKGNVSAAFEIYQCYIQRVQERCQLAHQILDTTLDFNADDYYLRDKDKLDYPRSGEEILARWTQKIKFEILSLEADERDKAKEEELKKKQDAQKQEGQNSAPQSGETTDSAEALPERDNSPVGKLHRRYSGLEKRIKQTANDDVLEVYLSAIANSYDPHSSYMSPKTFENFMIQMGLNLEGIGATLGWEDGYTVVKGIVKGGAAAKEGELEVEDRIIGVAQGKDGPFDDVVDMNLSDVVAKIRGKKGTLVRLEVRKAKGKGSKIIPIVREKIELEDSAAQGKVFEVGKKPDGTPWKVGVIDLPSFYLDMDAKERGDMNWRSTTKDVRKLLADFRQQNADACIIDLRFNGGGSLQEVVDLTGLFIETGTVVQVKPTQINPNGVKELRDEDPGIEWGGPLVVVTSKFSASASEIFAGAIKDYKRGLIIGDETTHGKGTVQPLIPIGDLLFFNPGKTLNYGTIKVSIQGFYLPHGESTQLIGVPSDIQLPSLTNHLDGTEKDSDYPLSFEKIRPAEDFPVFNYVTPEIITSLANQSKARISQSPDWAKVQKNIAAYLEIKELKKTPLNRTKYFEQLDRFDSEKEEKDEYERLMGITDEKIKRNFYMNELLDITADYLNLLHDLNIGFQANRVR